MEGDYGRLALETRKLREAKTLPNQLAAYVESIRLAERIRTSAWVLGDEVPGLTDESYWEIPKKLKDKLKEGGKNGRN